VDWPLPIQHYVRVLLAGCVHDTVHQLGRQPARRHRAQFVTSAYQDFCRCSSLGILAATYLSHSMPGCTYMGADGLWYLGDCNTSSFAFVCKQLTLGVSFSCACTGQSDTSGFGATCDYWGGATNSWCYVNSVCHPRLHQQLIQFPCRLVPRQPQHPMDCTLFLATPTLRAQQPRPRAPRAQ
jgi:hypothetical protein